MEVSRDGTVITVAHAHTVTFLDSQTLAKIREFPVPTTVNSASLHPDKSIFVAGGDDLKVYKFDYTTGVEIGTFCGFISHFSCFCSDFNTQNIWNLNVLLIKFIIVVKIVNLSRPFSDFLKSSIVLDIC